ncbi:MAG: patatin-like phospholipase family protein [Runella sp.]
MKKLTTNDYEQAVEPILEDLKRHFADKEFVVSDVIDNDGHQYVNLVQEGGGVLGIALVGYTYILEQMGVRFMKLAGTSAGAINTMLLASIGKRNDMKSVEALRILSSTNLFDFVDAFWVVRKLIAWVMKYQPKYTLRGIVFGIAASLVLAVVCSLFYWYYRTAPATPALVSALYALTGVLIIFSAVVVGYLIYLFYRFKRSRFGISRGNVFLKWLQDILEKNGVSNLADLRSKIEQPIENLQIRADRNEKINDLVKPKLENSITIIACDITKQVKVELPKMWRLYYTDESKVQPSAFVRASMSVPIFFEAFQINHIPRHEVQAAWNEFFLVEHLKDVPDSVKFVDGGIVSNFPINVFYNPRLKVPRLPTFGIMLDDEKTTIHQYQTFASFVMGLFNTVRFNYDREFLLKNRDFEKTIGRIDVRGYNWLDFNISDEKKRELFVKGAESAALFLKNFDWEAYKEGRRQLYEELN